MDPFSFVCGLIAATVVLVGSAIGYRLLLPWRKAFFNGAGISLMTIVGMRLRGHPVDLLVDAMIALRHSGNKTSVREVETIYVANQTRIHDSMTLINLVENQSSQN